MSLDFHPNYLWQTTYNEIPGARPHAGSLYLRSISFLSWCDHFEPRAKATRSGRRSAGEAGSEWSEIKSIWEN